MGQLNYDIAPYRNVPTQAANDVSSQPASTEFVQNLLPPGTVLPFAGAVPPTGWLLCDGSNVSRTTYARLFAVIGTTYGAGDGSTTFGLPDLRGEFIRGLDNGRGVDAGRTLGSSQGDENKAHRHQFLMQRSKGAASSAMPLVNGGNNNLPFNANGASTVYNSDLSSESLVSSEGGSEARPRNVALNYIIKSQ
jgi:Microcystin-dependent protein